MGEYKNLKRVVLNELRMLDEQYASKDQFSDVDAKKYDILAHALKCHLTACAMLKAEEEYDDDDHGGGMSGRRGRNMHNGEYVSREEANQSYSDGFQDGVNAMNNNQSGHHLMYPRYPYRERNW